MGLLRRLGPLGAWVLVLALVAAWSVWDRRQSGFRNAPGRALERFGKTPDADGFWVGDVAELFRRGRIPREVAEADAAPLHPLVPTPRPYCGYLFVAMESGPQYADEAVVVPLKGRTTHPETFAFCAFPADRNPRREVYIFCRTGFFVKYGSGQPVLRWPADEERRLQWGRRCQLLPPPTPSLAYVSQSSGVR